MELSYEVFIIKDESITKNNVYFIVDIETKNAAIVDPACNMEQVNNIVRSKGVILKTILITHVHTDHIRSVNDIVNQYNSNVYISKREADVYSYCCKNLITFDDNDEILIEKTKVTCMITPGHTAGSSCFLVTNGLFAGDTVFIEGCGNCTENGGSALDMYCSILRIKKQVGDSVLVYAGHTYHYLPGKPISFLKENNIYFLIENKEEFIEFRMRKDQKHLLDFK